MAHSFSLSFIDQNGHDLSNTDSFPVISLLKSFSDLTWPFPCSWVSASNHSSLVEKMKQMAHLGGNPVAFTSCSRKSISPWLAEATEALVLFKALSLESLGSNNEGQEGLLWLTLWARIPPGLQLQKEVRNWQRLISETF